MLSDKDSEFLRQRKRFQRYGPGMVAVLIVAAVFGIGYLVGRRVILISSCPLLFALFVITAIILVYCFYICVSIERRHLEIIDRLNQTNKE